MLLRMIIQQILLGHKSHGIPGKTEISRWRCWTCSFQFSLMSGKNKTTKHLVLKLWFITLHCRVLYCFVCGKYGMFTFFPPTDSCVYNDACLSGGHGGALAGVFVETARVWAAEAPRPSAETSVRGDCTSVWVLFPNVLMLWPADGGSLYVLQLLNTLTVLSYWLPSCWDKSPFFFLVKPSVASGLWSFSNQFLCFSFIKIDHVSQYCDVYNRNFVLISF